MRPSELLDPVSLDRADRAMIERYNDRARQTECHFAEAT